MKIDSPTFSIKQCDWCRMAIESAFRVKNMCTSSYFTNQWARSIIFELSVVGFWWAELVMPLKYGPYFMSILCCILYFVKGLLPDEPKNWITLKKILLFILLFIFCKRTLIVGNFLRILLKIYAQKLTYYINQRVV